MQSLPTLVRIIYEQCVLLGHHMRHMTCSAGRYTKQQVHVVSRCYLMNKVLQGGSHFWVYRVYIVVDNLYMAIILLSVIRCNLGRYRCSRNNLYVGFEMPPMFDHVNSERLGVLCSPRQAVRCRDSSPALTVNIYICTISTKLFGNTSEF
jgi:hypothetical protein